MTDKSEHSVMFLLGHWAVGGVERATVVLANELVKLGWMVTIAAFRFDDKTLLANMASGVETVELEFPVLRFRNMVRLRQVVKSRKIHFIVNQWALPFAVTGLLLVAKLGLGPVRLIAMQHNVPNQNKKIGEAKGKVGKIFWSLLSSVNLWLVYVFCDAHVVTSKSFISIFGRMIGIRIPKKSRAIRYPLTMNCTSAASKENAFIYVGRLENVQKRVDRIVNLWRTVSPELQDWRLDIVGDGPDRASLEAMTADLPRIKFHGFCDPSSFYANSKVILLTSDFEGFGLVLIEAMTAGCVPIIYGSYPAAYEIADGTNGMVLPPPYDEEVFADAMLKLANDPARLSQMSSSAMKKGREYSPCQVAAEYVALFEELEK